jgi:hypothetical protein
MKLSKQLTTQPPGLGNCLKKHQKAAGTATCTTQVAVVVMVVMHAPMARRGAGAAIQAMDMVLLARKWEKRGMESV